MKRSLKTPLLSIIVFTIVLIGVGSFAETDHIGSAKDFTHELSAAFSEDSDTSVYELSADITGIDIDWPNGDVQLIPYDGETIKLVAIKQTDVAQSKQIEYEIKNDVLYIIAKEGSVLPFVSEKYTDITCMVYIPQEIFQQSQKDISIQTVDGNIAVDGLNVGHLSLSSVSGTILTDGITAERITIQTTSGDIINTDSQSIVFESSTVSGTTESTMQARELIIDSVSGNISYTAVSMFDRADVQTISGNVTLYLPDNEGFHLHLSTTSGSFSCDKILELEGDARIYRNGKIPLNMQTVSGNVIVIIDSE